MSLDPAVRRRVLDRLSREPVAVVARALALDEEVELVGGADDDGLVLVHPRRGVAHLVGHMPPERLASALDEARAATVRGRARRRVFFTPGRPGDAPEVAALGLDPELLHLMALRTMDRVPPFVGASGPPPRVLDPEDLSRYRPLPDPLAVTLEEALGRPAPVHGVVIGNQVASFACAFWLGDLWWDMSVHTLPRFRRRGFGTACGVALIRALAPRGLFPVNAPETGSGGAPAFLSYLGFEAASSLVRWSWPEGPMAVGGVST